MVLHLKQPSGSLLYGLSEPHAAIYPKESLDAAGEGALKEFIGTGPFRFVEHRPDRHIKLARFKDYAARTDPPSGFAGKRTAWVDEILFLPVPDTAVRIAGVETGEYHHAMFVKQDAWERLKTNPAIDPRIVKPRGWAVGVLNHKTGLMTNKKLRQALQAALDMEPIMIGGFGFKEFYRLDPGLFFPEQTWHSTVSGQLYNQRDKAKARRLMQEAGYAKQPVRWVTTKEYEFMYKNALVAKQQMEEAGFVVDLQVVDWATLNNRTEKPEGWDVFSTGFVFAADPALHVSLRCTFNGWWCNEEKEKLMAELQGGERPEEAQGHRRARPDRLLRGRGQHQDGGLLHAGPGAPGPPGRLPRRAPHVLLERLAREVATRGGAGTSPRRSRRPACDPCEGSARGDCPSVRGGQPQQVGPGRLASPEIHVDDLLALGRVDLVHVLQHGERRVALDRGLLGVRLLGDGDLVLRKEPLRLGAGHSAVAVVAPVDGVHGSPPFNACTSSRTGRRTRPRARSVLVHVP